MKKEKKDKNIIFINVLIVSIMVAVGVMLLHPWVKTIQLNDALYEEQTYLASIHIEEVWKVGIRGKDVKIAVIDTGVNAHDDLNAERITGKSYVDEEESNYADSQGHGTFIVGLLAAEQGNEIGISGMTDSEIVVMKVVGDKPHIGIEHVSRAIYDAVDMGCSVINISMGTPNENEKLKAAIDYALSENVIIIAAVGGDEKNSYYPAIYEGVVGVDALTADLEPTKNAVRNESVFVTAPGEKIIGLSSNGGYERGGAGASYAAAQVTAFAAYAKQVQPDISPWSFMELLKESVLDKGDEGYDTTFGWGVINAGSFVSALTAMGK